MCIQRFAHTLTKQRNPAGVPSIVAAGGIPALVAAMQTQFTAADQPHSTRMVQHAWIALHIIVSNSDAHCETFALLGGIGMLVQVRNTALDSTDTTLFTR